MNKKFIVSTLIGVLLVPAFALAQDANTGTVTNTTASVTAVATTPTPAQVFTACTQKAIEVRDTTISSARTAYNKVSTDALSTRKDAEKAAVTLTDVEAKKAAMKTAMDAYKTSIKNAQEILTKARKDAWTQFETDTKACRDAKKAANDKILADKKAETEKKRVEAKALAEKKKTEMKAETEKKKEEAKTKREAERKTSTTTPTTGTR